LIAPATYVSEAEKAAECQNASMLALLLLATPTTASTPDLVRESVWATPLILPPTDLLTLFLHLLI
jgi:hypothetical protein